MRLWYNMALETVYSLVIVLTFDKIILNMYFSFSLITLILNAAIGGKTGKTAVLH